jgi:hypothetical protein
MCGFCHGGSRLDESGTVTSFTDNAALMYVTSSATFTTV